MSSRGKVEVFFLRASLKGPVAGNPGIRYNHQRDDFERSAQGYVPELVSGHISGNNLASRRVSDGMRGY